jgi:hypothetical protein
MRNWLRPSGVYTNMLRVPLFLVCSLAALAQPSPRQDPLETVSGDGIGPAELSVEAGSDCFGGACFSLPSERSSDVFPSALSARRTREFYSPRPRFLCAWLCAFASLRGSHPFPLHHSLSSRDYPVNLLP